MPCMPIAGIQKGASRSADRGGRRGRVREGDPDYPIWVGGYWGRGGSPGTGAARPPGLPSITLQTMLQNGILVSDVPGPTGGIMLKSTTGAAIIVNDTGIYIQNGKGASIVMVGPTVTVNAGARSWCEAIRQKGVRRCPGFLSTSGRSCCCATAGRRSGGRTPGPRQRPADRDPGFAVRRRRGGAAAGGGRAVRHRSVRDGGDAGHVARTAALAHRQHLPLRTDRDTPADPRD